MVSKMSTDTILVIPAKAGIQSFKELWTPVPAPDYDPGFAGVTVSRIFFEVIKMR
jgi:hypothetical protein